MGLQNAKDMQSTVVPSEDFLRSPTNKHPSGFAHYGNCTMNIDIIHSRQPSEMSGQSQNYHSIYGSVDCLLLVQKSIVVVYIGPIDEFIH